MPSRRGGLALIALAIVLVAVTRPRPGADEAIVWRLADAAARAGNTQAAVPLGEPTREQRGPARAVIRGDQRYTFTRPRPILIHRNAALAVSEHGEVALDLPLPPTLQGCLALVAEVAMGNREANDVRSVMGSCTGEPPAQRLSVTLSAAPVLRGGTADVWVSVGQPRASEIDERRFAITTVPAHARLELAYGVEEAGWTLPAPAVAFEVAIEGEAHPRFRTVLDPATIPAHRRWHRAVVSLDREAGHKATLILRTALVRAADRGPFSLPIWGDPTIVAGRDPTRPRPLNVLVVELDTLRAQSVSAYGAARPTTPFLDRLAADGILFEQAVAQSTITPVSNMSLFTGLYPRAHGVTDLAKPGDLSRYATLAELLRREGYATGAVTEDGLLAAQLGFERGFDAYRENKSAELSSIVGHIEETFTAGVEWMEAHRERPFFLFLHTYQVHAPYTPPRPYHGRFTTPGATGAAADRDRYEEEARYADDELARLWSALDRLDLAERTLVVVTSDHGEEFGEHGALDHGAHLYDETLMVPLVMSIPGATGGVRVPEPVALIDVVPTVLDVLGFPTPPDLDGLSLAAFTRDDSSGRAALTAALRKRAIYAEAWGAVRVLTDGSLDPSWQPPAYALRTSSLKAIVTPARAGTQRRIEIYDLARDPAEREPVRALQAPPIADAIAALERYEAIATRAAPSGAAATRAGPSGAAAKAPTGTAEPSSNHVPAGTPGPAALPDAATAEKLRALGYVR